MKASKKVRGWAKTAAQVYFRQTKMDPPMWDFVRTRAVFYHKIRRKRDGDNYLSLLKPVWDGFADAGVIKNDIGFAHYPVDFKVDKRDQRVEIHLEEA